MNNVKVIPVYITGRKSGNLDLATKHNQSNSQLLWPQLHADSALHECKTNTAALEQVCFGRNSAFCYLLVSLQVLLLPAHVRAHVCERLDHTLNLFAVTPCDMQQYYRLI